MVTLLNEIETSEFLSFIIRIAYGEAAVNELNSQDYATSDRIQFALGTEGGIQIKIVELSKSLTEDEIVDFTISYRQQMYYFVELLTTLKRKDIIGELIIKLLSNLQYITNRLRKCTSSLDSQFSTTPEISLNRLLRFKMITLYLLGAICETVDASVLITNKDQIFDFVISTVERAIDGLEDEIKELAPNESSPFEETINMSLMLISVVISSKTVVRHLKLYYYDTLKTV